MVKNKIATLAVAGMASLVLVGGTITPANAVDVVSGDVVAGLHPSDIIASKTVNLTIRKVVNPTPGEPTFPIEGITFSATYINGVDVTTEEGWEYLKKATIEELKAKAGTRYTATTDQDGFARFGKLPVGAYIVQEEPPLNAPEGYRPAESFVVILPVIDKETGTFRYDVTITPKTKPAVTQTPSTTPPTPPTTTSVVVPPPTGTVTTKPGVPPTGPSTAPDVPDKPNTPKSPGGFLPHTGANVIGVAILGLILAVAGSVMIAAKKRRRSGEEEA